MTWTDPNKAKPVEFDLVKLKDDKGRIFIGWWVGSFWDGYRKEEFGKILTWKKLSILEKGNYG